MQIVIDIPSAFIDHFHNDRFYDALMRLSSDAHLLAGLYEQETAEMLIKAFENAVEVPAHGRLVDADALETILENSSTALTVFDALREIDTMPTVIPKEEEA